MRFIACKRASALKSFGKQLRPDPMPALRYETAPANWGLPARSGARQHLSRRTPRMTVSSSRPGIASQTPAISLEKEIRVACNAFAAYLTISALRGVVCRSGQSNFEYMSANTEPARAVLAPITMRSGLVKSSTARPRSEIRGSWQARNRVRRPCPKRPRGSPRTTVSVVVGTTVLLTTTT